MHALLQDLRYGVRVLLRKPGYPSVEIACLVPAVDAIQFGHAWRFESNRSLR
ncbi:MAG: hypothetical protein O7G85_07580 [Planctomycetota bacterium]|nr:hypothetical protein [Planctomycetota bacterium]